MLVEFEQNSLVLSTRNFVLFDKNKTNTHTNKQTNKQNKTKQNKTKQNKQKKRAF